MEQQQIVAKPRHLAIVDLATGEVIEPNLMLIGRKPRRVDKGFIKVFVSFLSDIVEDPDVAGKSIRLLLLMIEKLEWNSFLIRISPKEAMKELQISRRTFYQWLDTLLKKEIIKKLDTHIYYLNTYGAVKGQKNEAIENLLTYK